MRKRMCCAAVVAMMSIGSLALADEMKSQAMTPPTPGEASKAIAKFFGRNFTWTGKVAAGAMGPDSKEAVSHGKAMGHELYGGFWYVCEVEDVMGTGKDAMTWKGHMLVGYDMGTNSYRAVTVDNMGMMASMNGTLDGDKFVLETPNEVMMMGQMMKDRLTFDASGGTIKFTDEHQVGGGEWTLAESAELKPSGATKSKTMAKQ